MSSSLTTSPTSPGANVPSTNPAARTGVWRWRLGGLLALLAVLLLVLTALRWLDAAHTIVAAIQAARPVWGVLGVFVLLGSLLTRRLAAIALAAVLVAVHAVLALPWILGAGTVPPRDDDLVVLSSNLEFGQAEPQALARQVSDRDVDVLVLTEVSPEVLPALQATSIGTQLPHRAGRPEVDAAGTVVLSRYPMTEVSRGTGTFGQPLVAITTPRGEVLLKAVHPMPPTSPLVWHRELTRLDAALTELTASDPRPLIVAGDFNATQDHPVYRPLTDIAKDAHNVAGKGWVRTWPMESSVPPFAHIDHILVNGLSVVDAGRVPVPGSDHAAVWARVQVP